MAKKRHGICRVCGNLDRLTAEHVIPKSAGNDRTIRLHNFQTIADGLRSGRRFQSGLVQHALCGSCNNLAGTHYVPAFARWTLKAQEYYDRLLDSAVVSLPFCVNALAVAKELAVMMLAMQAPESLGLPHFRRLRALVLQPAWYGRTPGFRFFTYFHAGSASFQGPFAAVSTSGGPTVMAFSHVGLSPLGYVVTGDDSGCLAWARRTQLCDVTHMFQSPPNEVRQLYLKIPRSTNPFGFDSSPTADES